MALFRCVGASLTVGGSFRGGATALPLLRQYSGEFNGLADVRVGSRRSLLPLAALFGVVGGLMLDVSREARAAETSDEEDPRRRGNPHCPCGGCDASFFDTPLSAHNILKAPLPAAGEGGAVAARTGRADFFLRPAVRSDMAVILKMMCSMAGSEYADQIQALADRLEAHLFGEHPYAQLLIGELNGEPIAFCLYYFTYSFFRVQPKMHLEDCWVDPKHRGKKYASQIAAHLFNVAVDRGCAMVEWDVELANRRAVDFFAGFGAEIPQDWVPIRVVGDDMVALAKSADFSARPSGDRSWFTSVRRYLGF